jgi:hypothetical protein
MPALLCGKQETSWIAESILGGADIDMREETESFDVALFVQSVIGHNPGLLLASSEMYCLGLGIVLHNSDDQETMNCKEVTVGIGTIPYSPCSRRAVIMIHAHARFV